MTSMASRTLLVDPKDDQKRAYELAHEAHEKLISNLTVGKTIGEAYQAAKSLIESKNKDLQIHNNFGFGIGFNFKEDALLINASNDTVIQAGMTFHARIAFSNVHPEQARSIVAIGDTVLVKKDGV